MDENASTAGRTTELLIWIAALVLHGASLLLAWVYHGNGQPLAAFMALALLAASAAVFVLPGLLAREWFRPRSTLLGLTAVLTLCLPVLGILGSLLTRLCAKALLHQKNKTKEFRESVEAALGEDSRWITRKRVGQVLADEIAIEPVIDVLQGDDPDLKRGAVKLLQRIGTPGAVALLRQSLADRFPEVRFYAHSALSDLEDAFTQRIQAINKTLQQAPSAGAYRALGQEYRTYADSGLADEIARRQHLESCREALINSLKLEPGHPQTMLLLGQALLGLNQPREAGQMFEKCTRHQSTVSEAQLGLAQIAYQSRDIGQLAAQARSMSASGAPRPEKADPLVLFEFWAAEGKVRHG